MKKSPCITLLVLLFFVTNVFAVAPQTHVARKPWGIFAYYGQLINKPLNQILFLRFPFQESGAKLYSLEPSYDLSPDNKLNAYAKYINASVGFALNATYQNDPQGDIYELNPYIKLTWSDFPWNRYLLTPLSFGEGVSYATRLSDSELRIKDNKKGVEQAKNPKRFLNYLMFEAAFSLPAYPNFQVVYHIHHRSGCFGLYEASNSGSTAIGVGVRYLF
ncbi:MAG: hypothetical protein AABY34_06095 [Pseudomonadota bacterium]|mgnify:CR=1 FL=1